MSVCRLQVAHIGVLELFHRKQLPAVAENDTDESGEAEPETVKLRAGKNNGLKLAIKLGRAEISWVIILCRRH